MGFPILVRWHLYIESGPWKPRLTVSRLTALWAEAQLCEVLPHTFMPTAQATCSTCVDTLCLFLYRNSWSNENSREIRNIAPNQSKRSSIANGWCLKKVLWKITLTNERRRYIRNVLSLWSRSCLAIVGKRALVVNRFTPNARHIIELKMQVFITDKNHDLPADVWHCRSHCASCRSIAMRTLSTFPTPIWHTWWHYDIETPSALLALWEKIWYMQSFDVRFDGLALTQCWTNFRVSGDFIRSDIVIIWRHSNGEAIGQLT